MNYDKSIIKSPDSALNDNKLIFDLTYPSLWKSFQFGNFTSYLRDSKMFVKFFKQFIDNINCLSNYRYTDLIKPNFKHCHYLKDDKLLFLKDILIAKYDNKNFFDELFTDSKNIFYFGTKQGLRFVGTNYENIIKVLLIDYHHLIYKSNSEKYNEIDLKVLKYCPVMDECEKEDCINDDYKDYKYCPFGGLKK